MDWKPFLYGGLASMAAELGTFPIDTTKTRLQVQGQVIDKSLAELKYRGMFHAMFRISKEEGLQALYNGIKPALLRQATYGTLKIGLYHGTKKIIYSDSSKETLFLNVCAGIIAGAISSAICNPTDVLKVRLQAQTQSSLKPNQGMLLAFTDIYRLEGFKGLYRGVGPTAQRASIIAGVELPVYDFSKKSILQSGLLGDNPTTHLIASLVAGLAGALTSNPIDVIKTRLMNQRNISGSVDKDCFYTGTVDCFIRSVVACTCNAATLEAELLNGVRAILVGDKSLLIVLRQVDGAEASGWCGGKWIKPHPQ